MNVHEAEGCTQLIVTFSILGCVASGAMLGYAYSSGLLDIIRNVEIRVVDDDDEEEDD